MSTQSTRPYLIRAIYEWCIDNGYTPYITAKTSERFDLPAEYIKSGVITLSIIPSAVCGLVINNDLVQFKARFSGVPRNLQIPISAVIAIFAKEIGQGLTFSSADEGKVDDDKENSSIAAISKNQLNVNRSKPYLKIIK